MCVKKFIFSKFADLEAYSRQLYYRMNSVTGIYWQYFKPPMVPTCIDLNPSPIKFWRAPSMFITPVGNPEVLYKLIYIYIYLLFYIWFIIYIHTYMYAYIYIYTYVYILKERESYSLLSWNNTRKLCNLPRQIFSILASIENRN